LLENSLSFKNDKNKILAVEEFKIDITVDKPLLTNEMKKLLNPLMINVIGAK
jgi:hypothetical protein